MAYDYIINREQLGNRFIPYREGGQLRQLRARSHNIHTLADYWRLHTHPYGGEQMFRGGGTGGGVGLFGDENVMRSEVKNWLAESIKMLMQDPEPAPTVVEPTEPTEEGRGYKAHPQDDIDVLIGGTAPQAPVQAPLGVYTRTMVPNGRLGDEMLNPYDTIRGTVGTRKFDDDVEGLLKECEDGGVSVVKLRQLFVQYIPSSNDPSCMFGGIPTLGDYQPPAYPKVFERVWWRIKRSEHRDELVRLLNGCIDESVGGVCPLGQYSRVVGVLCGFDVGEDIHINISTTEWVGNLMANLRSKYESGKLKYIDLMERATRVLNNSDIAAKSEWLAPLAEARIVLIDKQVNAYYNSVAEQIIAGRYNYRTFGLVLNNYDIELTDYHGLRTDNEKSLINKATRKKMWLGVKLLGRGAAGWAWRQLPKVGHVATTLGVMYLVFFK